MKNDKRHFLFNFTFVELRACTKETVFCRLIGLKRSIRSTKSETTVYRLIVNGDLSQTDRAIGKEIYLHFFTLGVNVTR